MRFKVCGGTRLASRRAQLYGIENCVVGDLVSNPISGQVEIVTEETISNFFSFQCCHSNYWPFNFPLPSKRIQGIFEGPSAKIKLKSFKG